MNAKRQTVWLVSMLSLMVVLSAYYLFSDELKNLDDVSGIADEADRGGAAVVEGDALDSLQMSDYMTGDAIANSLDQTNGSTLDEQVLKIVQNQGSSGADALITLQLLRNEEMGKREEQLLTLINSKEDAEVVESAWDEYYAIQDQEAKLTNLEQLLEQKFNSVAVMEQSGKWNVYVHNDTLELSEAVGIFDLATRELSISAANIEIKHVQ